MPIEDRIRAGLSRNAEVPVPPVEHHLAEVRRRHRRRLVARLAVAAAVVIIVGTVPLALLTKLADRAQEPARPGPPSLPGTYSVVIDGAAASDLRGTWRVTLAGDGSVTLTPPPTYRGAVTKGATYEMSGAQLTTNVFVDSPGCQRTAPPVGVYHVAVSTDRAVFTPVHDSCPPRLALFRARWERVP
jgi:hypothetical protein